MSGRTFARRVERLESVRSPAQSLHVIEPGNEPATLIAAGIARSGDLFIRTGVPRQAKGGPGHA